MADLGGEQSLKIPLALIHLANPVPILTGTSGRSLQKQWRSSAPESSTWTTSQMLALKQRKHKRNWHKQRTANVYCRTWVFLSNPTKATQWVDLLNFLHLLFLRRFKPMAWNDFVEIWTSGRTPQCNFTGVLGIEEHNWTSGHVSHVSKLVPFEFWSEDMKEKI